MNAGLTNIRKSLVSFSALAALALMNGIASGAALQQDAAALPFVSPIFGDHMVLQRGKPNRDLGMVAAGRHGARGDRRALRDGNRRSGWPLAGANRSSRSRAGPTPSRSPGSRRSNCRMCWSATCGSARGQSNMQFGLGQARNGADEIKNANHPQIRYYVVGQRVSYSRVDVPRGSWRVVSPSYGRRLRRNLRGGLFLRPKSARVGARAHRLDSGGGGRRSRRNVRQRRKACGR